MMVVAVVVVLIGHTFFCTCDGRFHSYSFTLIRVSDKREREKRMSVENVRCFSCNWVPLRLAALQNCLMTAISTALNTLSLPLSLPFSFILPFSTVSVPRCYHHLLLSSCLSPLPSATLSNWRGKVSVPIRLKFVPVTLRVAQGLRPCNLE